MSIPLRLPRAVSTTQALDFTYDSSGLRTSKTVDGVTHKYLYAGGKLMRETYGSNTLDFFYDANGTPYALKYNGTVYYYITNLQGDVIQIVDASGNAVATYEYDPYGKVISATGTLAETNPIRYRGYYYDTETGLYYLQSRYYDPEIVRFVNGDSYASTGQGLLGNNMFAYCVSNPVNMSDPAGHCSYVLFVKMDCLSATCSDSLCYNPDAPNVVVIYDGRFSGYLGYGGDHGFEHQGTELCKRLSITNAVTSYPYTTVEDFVDIWNGLNGSYDTIYIVGHGYEGELRFKGGHSIATQNGDYSYSDLNSVSVNNINLYVCNGATVYGEKGSIARHLSDLTGSPVRALKDGKLNFSWFGCIPYPKGGGRWVTVR